MTRFGLVGLDMSHAVAFTEMLNDPGHPFHVPGGRVVAGYPGGSADFELSRSRVDAHAGQLRERWNVAIVDSPRAVAEAADVVLITGADGRQHRGWFEALASLQKPVFVGKPIALSTVDATAMFTLAAKHGTLLMSSSALRFSEMLCSVARDRATVRGCDVFGPAPLQPTQPGLFWYGIHAVEMAVAVMGTGCVAVQSLRTEQADLTTLHYRDGRVTSVRGLRGGASTFGLTVHQPDGARSADTSQFPVPTSASLLRAIVEHLPRGVSPVPAAETLEVIRIVEAANHSQQTGRPVTRLD